MNLKLDEERVAKLRRYNVEGASSESDRSPLTVRDVEHFTVDWRELRRELRRVERDLVEAVGTIQRQQETIRADLKTIGELRAENEAMRRVVCEWVDAQDEMLTRVRAAHQAAKAALARTAEGAPVTHG